MSLLGSLISFYNTVDTASVTFKQYTFTIIRSVHFHIILEHLVFDIVDFLLHDGNGLYSFMLVIF